MGIFTEIPIPSVTLSKVSTISTEEVLESLPVYSSQKKIEPGFFARAAAAQALAAKAKAAEEEAERLRRIEERKAEAQVFSLSLQERLRSVKHAINGYRNRVEAADKMASEIEGDLTCGAGMLKGAAKLAATSGCKEIARTAAMRAAQVEDSFSFVRGEMYKLLAVAEDAAEKNLLVLIQPAILSDVIRTVEMAYISGEHVEAVNTVLGWVQNAMPRQQASVTVHGDGMNARQRRAARRAADRSQQEA